MNKNNPGRAKYFACILFSCLLSIVDAATYTDCGVCEEWDHYAEDCVPLPAGTSIDGEPCKECDGSGGVRNRPNGYPCSSGFTIARCCDGSCIDITAPPSCPPKCEAGQGISNTKIFVNGNQTGNMMGPDSSICDGDSVNVTGTGDDTDIENYYKFSFAACKCVYDYETVIPGSVTMTVDSIGPTTSSGACTFWKHIKVTFKSECDDADVPDQANVQVLKCDETHLCCMQESTKHSDWRDVRLAQQRCHQRLRYCQRRCP